MKNTKKRGFTIVELVIVIAVIAILASVLIPTFSNIVTNAKEPAAMQNARSAWTAYLVDLADGGNALPDKDVNGCIESGDYHFEIKAGTFTGAECKNGTAHDCYTIVNGKINVGEDGKAVITPTHTYTATPAPDGGNEQGATGGTGDPGEGAGGGH